MNFILGKAYKLLCLIMVVFMIVMTLLVFLNTVLRYCTNTSIITSEEISRFLFVWTIFIGGILAVADDIHIRVDLVTRRLPAGWQRFLRILSNAFMVLVCVIMAIGGWTQTILNVRNYAPTTDIPLAYVNVSCFIAGVGMGAICLVRLVKDFLPAKEGRVEQ